MFGKTIKFEDIMEVIELLKSNETDIYSAVTFLCNKGYEFNSMSEGANEISLALYDIGNKIFGSLDITFYSCDCFEYNIPITSGSIRWIDRANNINILKYPYVKNPLDTESNQYSIFTNSNGKMSLLYKTLPAIIVINISSLDIIARYGARLLTITDSIFRDILTTHGDISVSYLKLPVINLEDKITRSQILNNTKKYTLPKMPLDIEVSIESHECMLTYVESICNVFGFVDQESYIDPDSNCAVLSFTRYYTGISAVYEKETWLTTIGFKLDTYGIIEFFVRGSNDKVESFYRLPNGLSGDEKSRAKELKSIENGIMNLVMKVYSAERKAFKKMSLIK